MHLSNNRNKHHVLPHSSVIITIDCIYKYIQAKPRHYTWPLAIWEILKNICITEHDLNVNVAMMVFRFGPVPSILQITRTGLIDCSKYSNSIMGTAAQQQQILCIAFFSTKCPSMFYN